MFCPKCGNEIKEGTKFCTKCGYELVNKQVSVQQSTNLHQNPKPNNTAKTMKKNYIKIIGLIIGIIIIFYGKETIIVDPYESIICVMIGAIIMLYTKD